MGLSNGVIASVKALGKSLPVERPDFFVGKFGGAINNVVTLFKFRDGRALVAFFGCGACETQEGYGDGDVGCEMHSGCGDGDNAIVIRLGGRD